MSMHLIGKVSATASGLSAKPWTILTELCKGAMVKRLLKGKKNVIFELQFEMPIKESKIVVSYHWWSLNTGGAFAVNVDALK